MRLRSVLGLIVVAAFAALLSGGAAGAAATVSAIVTAAGYTPVVPAPAVDTTVVDTSRLAVAAPVVGPFARAVAPGEQADPSPPSVSPAFVSPAPPTIEPTTTEPTPEPTPEPTLEPTPVPEIEPAEEPEPTATPCRSSARACVELSSNRAWLVDDDGELYGPVPITHGRKGYRTPTGTFRVSFKNRDHVSSIYDAPMPYSVFFNGGIAFHQGSLEERSHGCIHLSRSAARAFYSSLDPGDVVQVVS